MKTILAFVLVSVITVNSLAQVSFGEPMRINQNWKFNLADTPGAEACDFDDSRWQNVNVPHDWSVLGLLSPCLASCTGYLPGGIGWYRKSINIPEARRGQKVYLYFEGVYSRSDVYFNGQLLGHRPNGYISFMYDATPHVKFGEDNIIAVRVDRSNYADSRWYTGAGIYRDVHLVYANTVHIAQWGVFAHPDLISNSLAFVNAEVEVLNGSGNSASIVVASELISPSGVMVARASQRLSPPVAGTGTVKFRHRVRNPLLWDLDNPHLYILKTTVTKDGRIIDQTTTRTGIRSFTFSPATGFYLNGINMKMKGVCLHHDAGVLGAKSFKEVWRRRLLTLKEMGVNAIRTTHNPMATHFYELCDELGLLVLNEAYDEWEFPKRKWLDGWNVGTPGFQGTYDFFAEWGERDLADMVRRDRNHVSIFAWSIGNEVDFPNDPYSHPILDGGGYTGFTQAIFGGFNPEAPCATRLGDIAKRLAAVVRRYDPTRPVTAGLAGVVMSNATDFPAALDIVGYNYSENMFDIDRERFPQRVIYSSESRHDLRAWQAVASRDFIFGQFLWTGIDYLGESRQWPSRGFYSGLLDLGGFLKPRGYFRKSLWAPNPMIYIGTYPIEHRGRGTDVWSQLDDANAPLRSPVLSIDAEPLWNYSNTQVIRVVAYTNSRMARLILNGKQVGELKEHDPVTGIIYWDLPFEAGTLVAEGVDENGTVVATTEIHTTGRPYALRVVEQAVTIGKGHEVAHVTIEVVDENGLKVLLADNEVTCQIAGSARLLGLEGSNNSDMSIYTDNRHRVFQGRLLAYIQSTGIAGEVRVRFTAPLLKPAEVVINVK